MPVIMGTAGHIDHGKTTLVKALTGIDCDRLAEEKKRGITIELGFAFMDQDDGSRLGIVDVPGHEKFVKNMVAGAAGVDFVLLVIAADEGIMPQTREHLDICRLLGIETGLVALTKTDMVEPDWLDMVREEVADYLEPTFLGGASILPVSAHTGAGLEELRAALVTLTAEYRPKRRSDLFRLPVDRVFTMKGHGTVITGTMISGTLNLGEEVRLYPGELTAKARGLQSHGQTVETAQAGRRTAVNLQGVEVDDVRRGDVAARPGTLYPSRAWTLELTLLESSRLPLKHRKEVHFHHGAREVMARVYLLDRDVLKPGETGVCEVRFTEPMAGVYGDRVVLRSFSPLRAFAGGRIISPVERRIKRFSPQVDQLRSLGPGEPGEVAATQLDLAGPGGLTFGELAIMTNAESKGLEKELQALCGARRAVLFDKEERRYAGGALADDLSRSMLDFLADYHRRESMKGGMPRSELASSWGSGRGRDVPAKLFHVLAERLIKAGELVAEQDAVRLPGHTVTLGADQTEIRERVLAAFEAGGVTPPNVKDVLEPMGLTFKQAAAVFRLLQEQGMLIRVKDDMFYAASAIDRIKADVEAYFADHEEMTAPDFKGVTGLSRKYLIPLLEYFDREKYTVRVGDARRLRKGF